MSLNGQKKIPSAGTMKICIGTYAYITNICAIAELRKTKVIDSIKYEANEIIIIRRTKNKIIIIKGKKKLVNFFANIEAMWKKCPAFCD